MATAASSMSDGLMQILTTLAGLKVTPDADAELLSNLEALIVTGIQQSQAADLEGQLSSLGGPAAPTSPGPMAGGVGMDMAPMGAVPPGPPMPMPGGPGSPMGGRLPMAPAPPNPDELRRIMSLG